MPTAGIPAMPVQLFHCGIDVHVLNIELRASVGPVYAERDVASSALLDQWHGEWTVRRRALFGNMTAQYGT